MFAWLNHNRLQQNGFVLLFLHVMAGQQADVSLASKLTYAAATGYGEMGSFCHFYMSRQFRGSGFARTGELLHLLFVECSDSPMILWQLRRRC
jgi:hypothetical protein